MKNARILVVDDDVDFAESLGEALESHGHEVVMVHSGETAIATFREDRFDIAFVDVRLPGMDGVESFFELRRIHPDAKVMMMTGYSMEDLLQQAIEHGALGVLDKPLNINEVLDTIQRVLPDGIVLLADDDPDFVDSVSTALQGQGYSVLVAKDGGEAVDLVTQNSVDVLILDLKLPVLDGLQVYLRLKDEERTLPTLIVTGFAEEETEKLDALRQLTGQGFLKKPFDPQALLDGVHRMLQER